MVHLSQDSFYRELNPQEITKANKGMFNFDHPDAFDNELMESVGLNWSNPYYVIRQGDTSLFANCSGS